MKYRDAPGHGEGLSYVEREAIVQVAQACASLSFLGSAVIVVANFRFKQLRTYSFQLVVWLAVCDMFANLSYFLGSHIEGSMLCYIQAIVQQFFQVAVIQWTLLISHSLLVMASSTRAFEGDKRMPWNHLWAWGISAVLTIGPVCTGSYGASDCTFCWIKSGDSWNEGSLWRTVFLAMVALSMVAIVWMYVTVVKHLGRTQRGILLLSSHASKGRRRDSPATCRRGQYRRKSSKSSTTSSMSFDGMLRPTSSRPDVPLPLFLDPLRLSDRSGASPSQERAGSSEGNGGEGPQRRAPRATSLWKRWVKGDEPSTGDGQRSVGLEQYRSNDSQSSGFSFTRSNSQISAKDWLWSTSREAGFFGDRDVSDREEEERENVLWLNSSATAARSTPGALDQGKASKPLPTLPEAGLSTNATSGAMKSIDFLACTPCRLPSRPSRQEQQTPPTPYHEAITSRAVSPCTAVDGAAPSHHSRERNAVGSAALDGYAARPVSGRLFSTTSPAVATTGDRNSNADAGLVSADSVGERDLAPTRKTCFTYRVGKARGYVRRMSSIDLGDDHLEHSLGHGGIDAANAQAGRKGAPGHAGKVQRDAKVTLWGPRSGGRGMLTKQPRGRSRPGNMDKFISRVKWYPVIYVLCWIFTLINGSYTVAVGPQNASFTLVMLATVSSRLQGLLNFLWYGLNDSLKQAWLQDFLYRKAVASCCRALWCCCSSPCCRKYDFEDEKNVSTDKLSQVADARDEAGSSSADSIDLADSMEQGTGVGSTVASSSPQLEATPTSSSRSWIVPCATPSVPRQLQGLAPRRPARSSRNAVHPHSQTKAPRTQSVRKQSMAVPASRCQARTTWKTRPVLSRPARAFHKTGITPPRFRLKSRKRSGKAFKGGRWAVATLSSALPMAVSMPMVAPSVQVGSSPSQTGSAYSSWSGSDYLLEAAAVNFGLSGYIRDRASADRGESGSEDEHERAGDGDSNSVDGGSISSTSVDDDRPSVPGGNVTDAGRSGSTRPGGAIDSTSVEGRAVDHPTRSIEEADAFSERFAGGRNGFDERKEPL